MQAFVEPSIDAFSSGESTRTAEERARRLLARLMRNRRVLPGCRGGAPDDEEVAPHLSRVMAALVEERPLELILPAFPAKSPSPRKVLGALPDLAERVALRSLQALCDEIAAESPNGVELVLCSDGLVFSDVVGVRDEDVFAYGAEIDQLLAELPSLRRFDLAHAFGSSTPDEARRWLLDSFAEPEEALVELSKRSAPLRAQLDGMHRFLFEDMLGASPELSRSQARKRARARAVQVLLRSRAWGSLLSALFPRAIRLSIHPQPSVSDKIGVHLIPTRDAWLTPWHGVAMIEGNRLRLAKRAEAEAIGATCVQVNGRPSHYMVAA